MQSEWLDPKEVDWKKLFDDGTSILIYGCWQSSAVADYACGHIHTLSDDSFHIESFIQGEVRFLLKDVKKVMALNHAI